MYSFNKGEHSMDINCWRPVGPSVVSSLRRFFIGGAPELEDLSYTHVPSSFHVSSLSHTMTGTKGQAVIRLSILSV